MTKGAGIEGIHMMGSEPATDLLRMDHTLAPERLRPPLVVGDVVDVRKEHTLCPPKLLDATSQM